MEFPSLLRLTRRDVYAFLLFCMAGVLVACIIRDPVWAIYSFALVTDHLFLGWLVFLREVQVKRSLPIAAIVPIHIVFALFVIALVADRQHIPRFGLLPLPLAAIGISILSSAAGREVKEEGPHRPRALRYSSQPAHRERLTTGKNPRPASAQTSASANAIAQIEPAAPAANEAVCADLAQIASTEDGPQPQAIADARGQIAADTVPDRSSSANGVSEQSEDTIQTQLAEIFRQLGTSMYAPDEIAPEKPVPAEPMTGTDLPPTAAAIPEAVPAASSSFSEFVPFRDNSIAEGIRQKHSEHLTRLKPILSATAEDNEEWLKHRGTQNPTHRKIGLSVREEYEQWLIARAEARAAKESPNTPAPMKPL